ncbi:MAG: DNA-binding domain-containing protein [Burkholderiaceae bacterium]|nr:DNA-binding domain-containing protein [Burkholderiaceae bacterium]
MTAAGACSQAAFAAALLDPALPCPTGLVAWNRSDPSARLAVYRNNVVSSLIDALAETFPVVQALVGVEFFRAMAAVFVRRQPPRSPVLASYGEGFPAFIEAFAPAASLPYLADVARLEAARVRAYHAADAEPVASAVVATALASGERIGELRLALHPSASVLDSPHPVVTIWAAHQGDGEIGAIEAHEPEAALVLRAELDVLVLRLPAGGAAFVAAIRRGVALGGAASSASLASDAFDLSSTLTLLLGHGALTSIHLPRRLAS